MQLQCLFNKNVEHKWTTEVIIKIKNNISLILDSVYVDDTSDGAVTALLSEHPTLDILINISGYKIAGSK